MIYRQVLTYNSDNRAVIADFFRKLTAEILKMDGTSNAQEAVVVGY